MKYTDDYINELKPNQIFVFGSNLKGIHGAGAAKLAFDKFGAVWGVGIGHQGRTYALPTKDANIYTLPLTRIEEYVMDFLDYAKENSQFEFIVTKIGCGLAGYSYEDIAPMFKHKTPNVIIPKEFHEIISHM